LAKGFQGKKKGSPAEKKAIKKAQSKRKNGSKKKNGTKKGGVRNTAQKAFNKAKKTTTTMPRKGLKGLTSSSTLKKVALGVGGATLATAMISFIAPNSSLGKFAPAAGAYALGGIEGIIGNFALGMLRPQPTGNQNVVPAMEVL